MELGDGAEVTPRNHGPVLEPEVEQIAVDDERAAEIRDGIEKAMERRDDRGRDLSEMRVGDDEDARGWGRHGAQARNAGRGPQARVPFDSSRQRVAVAPA